MWFSAINDRRKVNYDLKYICLSVLCLFARMAFLLSYVLQTHNFIAEISYFKIFENLNSTPKEV